MFGDGHHLDGVVTELGDTREDEGAKLVVGANALALGSDAKVGFVDARSSGLGGTLIFPLIGLRGMPNGAGELVVVEVLGSVAREGGEAKMGAVVALDGDFVVGEVAKGVGGEGEVPVAIFITGGRVRVIVPVIKVADEGEKMGVGRILAVGPLLVRFVKEEAVAAMESGLILEGDLALVFEEAVATFGDGIAVGCKPRIVGDESEFFFHNVKHGKSGLTNRARFS